MSIVLDFASQVRKSYIHDFSRLARSTTDLLSLVEYMTAKGVILVSNKENVDTSTATGKLMLTMIGAINEFERANLLERQKEGIAIAKQQGKFKGRKEIAIKDFDKHYEKYMSREINKSDLAKELKITRPTLDKSHFPHFVINVEFIYLFVHNFPSK